jgi:hypothetical protein
MEFKNKGLESNDVQNCLLGLPPTSGMSEYAPLKRRSTIILHGSISQKTFLNIILAARLESTHNLRGLPVIRGPNCKKSWFLKRLITERTLIEWRLKRRDVHRTKQPLEKTKQWKDKTTSELWIFSYRSHQVSAMGKKELQWTKEFDHVSSCIPSRRAATGNHRLYSLRDTSNLISFIWNVM